MEWLQFCYCTLCGYSKEEYLDSTLPELIYQIRNYKKFNTPPDKKGNYNNQHNNGIKSAEKETYGRVDEFGNPISLDEIMGE